MVRSSPVQIRFSDVCMFLFVFTRCDRFHVRVGRWTRAAGGPVAVVLPRVLRGPAQARHSLVVASAGHRLV